MIEILDVVISRNQDRDQGIEPEKSVGRSNDLLERTYVTIIINCWNYDNFDSLVANTARVLSFFIHRAYTKGSTVLKYTVK